MIELILIVFAPIVAGIGGWLARSKKIHSSCFGIEMDIEQTGDIARELTQFTNEMNETKKVNPHRWNEVKSKLDIITAKQNNRAEPSTTEEEFNSV